MGEAAERIYRTSLWLAMAIIAMGTLLTGGALAQSKPARNLVLGAASANEQRVALVIGNAAYKDAPLRNPVNDATDIAAALRTLGFSVTLKSNANQRQMKDAIRDFGNQLAKGGVGLFYFAGHGIQFRGRNFLVPVGANIERESHVEDETVDAGFVLAQMEEARNRVNIVVLDACRNNPYSRGFRSVSRGLAQMEAAQGTLVAFATAPGAVAQDGDGRNGIYTKHLLQQMRAPGLPVELMLKRVRDGVIVETKDQQVPWESSSLRGADFYFVPGGASAPAPNVAQPAPPPTDPATLELALWESVKDSKNADELQAYLEQYPNGRFAGVARARLKSLQGPQQVVIAPPTIARSDVSPEGIYKYACAACHDAGVAGAPKFGDRAGWAPRILMGKDALYRSAIFGKPGTAMMAKGGASNLSDTDVRAVVDLMVARAR